MSVVVTRSILTEKDKSYIKEHLIISSNTDPPVVIKPFIVDLETDTVRLPFSFYRELRQELDHADWTEFPNDLKHQTRFTSEWQFTGSLRDYQTSVWSELYQLLKDHRAGLLAGYTGFGKTTMTIYLASKVQLPTLILYHIRPLGRSWPTSFNAISNAVVCHLNTEPYNPNAHIYIASIDRALTENFPLDYKKIGLLVVDEAHAFATQRRVSALLKVEPKYYINLTATPTRADGLGQVLKVFHGQTGREIIRVSPNTYTIYKHRTGFRPKIETTTRGLNWQVVKNSLLTRPTYIALICDWVMLNPDRKILIHVVQLDQLQAIMTELKNRGETEVRGFYGQMGTYEDCRVLVGLDRKIGVGFDDATTCQNYGGRRFDTLILTWTIKDLSSLEQTIGRLRQDKGIVVDFVHSFSSFEKHWAGREKWYQGRKFRIMDASAPIQLQ